MNPLSLFLAIAVLYLGVAAATLLGGWRFVFGRWPRSFREFNLTDERDAIINAHRVDRWG